MQKIAWEISWENAEHLERRSLRNRARNQKVDDQTEADGARMNTDSKDTILSGDGSRLATAEQRLRHFALDTKADEIAALIGQFMKAQK